MPYPKRRNLEGQSGYGGFVTVLTYQWLCLHCEEKTAYSSLSNGGWPSSHQTGVSQADFRLLCWQCDFKPVDLSWLDSVGVRSTEEDHLAPWF